MRLINLIRRRELASLDAFVTKEHSRIGGSKHNGVIIAAISRKDEQIAISPQLINTSGMA